MSLRIISVGKPSDAPYQSLVDDFEKRLPKYLKPEWLFISPSGHEKDAARRAESDLVRAKLASSDLVVLCDERGTELTSEAFAGKVEAWLGLGRPITFIIGGAYGVDAGLRQRADFVWSLSPLVFPHQVVRLILAEQLYRAHAIASGHPYHHV